MEQTALHGTPLHDRKRLARHGAGHAARNAHARQEIVYKIWSRLHCTERPCTTGNALQDTEQVAPQGMPSHDRKRLARHGAGRTARNAHARQEIVYKIWSRSRTPALFLSLARVRVCAKHVNLS